MHTWRAIFGLLSCLGLCFAMPSAARGQTNLIPTDDNIVLKSVPDTVQTNGTTLPLKVASTSQTNARIAFMKFDLSGIPSIADPVTFTATLNSAAGTDFTLRLFGLNAGASGSGWTEDTITYTNRPAASSSGFLVDTTQATQVGGNVSIPNGTAGGTTASFTFSGMEDYRQPDNSATLILLVSAQSSNTPSLTFNSSEAASGQPTLTVTPEPATVSLLAIAGMAVLARRRRY